MEYSQRLLVSRPGRVLLLGVQEWLARGRPQEKNSCLGSAHGTTKVQPIPAPRSAVSCHQGEVQAAEAASPHPRPGCCTPQLRDLNNPFPSSGLRTSEFPDRMGSGKPSIYSLCRSGGGVGWADQMRTDAPARSTCRIRKGWSLACLSPESRTDPTMKLGLIRRNRESRGLPHPLVHKAQKEEEVACSYTGS